MSYSQAILPEFEREVVRTRAVLERIPDDKHDWRPHPQSNTIGWQANHLADILEWVENILTEPSFDVAPKDGEPFKTSEYATTREILAAFDRNVVTARKALEAATDEVVAQPWSLLAGGEPLMTMPRETVVRDFALNHTVHHRAVLSLCFRMAGIPVPDIYGPSGEPEVDASGKPVV
ncbi:MAG: DinB family protein [Phycisphaeraceae bacterium]|nr:MAG: DinB family protein [Phycisphaeraceae bacterium]